MSAAELTLSYVPVRLENESNEENNTEAVFFKIHRLQEKEIPDFDSKIRSIKVDLTSIPQREYFLSKLKSLMKKIYERLVDKCEPRDLISLTIVTDTLEFECPDKAFKPADKLDHTQLEDLIRNMVQSKAFDVGDSFEIRATIYTHRRSYSCYCKICRSSYTDNHERYITPLPDNNYSSDECKSAFLFYDFETMQEKDDELGKKLHEVNLCVAQVVCHECFNSDLEEKCTFCGRRKTLVFRKDPVRELVNFVCSISLTSHIRQIICIAHNSQNYDAQFILKHVVENLGIKPFLCVNGTSIIFMSFDSDRGLKIKFIDSFSYFGMKLAKLPETFGFEGSHKKGDFPHLFNTTGNQNYKGPLPAESYYAIDDMKEQELSEFRNWHKELREQNYEFDFRKEILDYCRTDVNILRKACYLFRKMFIERANIDPFAAGATMATTCMKIFRTKFLQANSIGIIPNGGYRKQRKTTRLAVEWLLMVERDIGKEILHIGRGGEHRVNDDIVVDGYLLDEDGTKRAYQFYECLWQGCPRCFESNRDKIIKRFGDSYNARYEKTKTRGDTIKRMGYILTEMWECDFEGLKSDNEHFLVDHPMLFSDALNPRDAFYGGRIETYTAHRQICGDEKIHYIDICSLYPWVNKYRKVPIRHPKVYVGDDCKELTGLHNDLSSVEGLVKCRILAPRDLYHPVLPMRINNRTMFSLCRLCSENSVKVDCHHEKIEDREFTGTWVSDELKKAVEMGYRIQRIYEIWQYKVEQYDKRTRQGGIFAGYVDMLLQWKQSASGWPADCTTDEDRQRFVEEYERREGIQLNPEEIAKNPGLRFISKRCMNSLWGKFGQADYNTYEIMKSPSDLRDIASCSRKKLESLQFVEDKSVAYCKWMEKDEYIKPSMDKNVAVAAYTTAQARLKLYTYLELLGDRVLYCHTDSCIYVSSPEKGHDQIETGNFLGDMTDELADEYGRGAYVREFVSCGAALYSMIVVKPDGSETTVTKGVIVNASSKDTYSHENIKALALGEKDVIRHTLKVIRRTNRHEVVSCEQKKISKTSFLKRKFPNSWESYPFGHKKLKN